MTSIKIHIKQEHLENQEVKKLQILLHQVGIKPKGDTIVVFKAITWLWYRNQKYKRVPSEKSPSYVIALSTRLLIPSISWDGGLHQTWQSFPGQGQLLQISLSTSDLFYSSGSHPEIAWRSTDAPRSTPCPALVCVHTSNEGLFCF